MLLLQSTLVYTDRNAKLAQPRIDHRFANARQAEQRSASVSRHHLVPSNQRGYVKLGRFVLQSEANRKRSGPCNLRRGKRAVDCLIRISGRDQAKTPRIRISAGLRSSHRSVHCNIAKDSCIVEQSANTHPLSWRHLDDCGRQLQSTDCSKSRMHLFFVQSRQSILTLHVERKSIGA